MPNPVMRRRLEAAAAGGTTAPLAAQFVNAQNQGLTIASNASLSMAGTDWCAVCWAKFTSVNAYRRLIVKADTGTFDWGMQLNPTAVGGGPGIEAFSTGGNAGMNLAITTGVWYFCVAQFTFNIGSISCQVNNGAAGSNVGSVTNTAAAFGIGALGNVGDATSMDGLIDAAGIWKRNLSAGELTALYNGGMGVRMGSLSGAFLTNLISLWDFNTRGNPGLDGFGTNNLANRNGVTQVAGLT